MTAVEEDDCDCVELVGTVLWAVEVVEVAERVSLVSRNSLLEFQSQPITDWLHLKSWSDLLR